MTQDCTTSGRDRYIRVAELEIHRDQLSRFADVAREQIKTSVRVEPGVLALYAVAEKDDPARVIVFEMYADEAAYKAHIESPHFRNYKSATQNMVKSLKLIETVPLTLAAKVK